MDAHIQRVDPPPYMRRFFAAARDLVRDGQLDLEAFARIRNAVWPEAKPIDIDELRAQLATIRRNGKAVIVWWLTVGELLAM